MAVPVDAEAVDGEAFVRLALPGDVLTDRTGQFDAVAADAGGEQFGVDVAAVDEVLTGQQPGLVESPLSTHLARRVFGGREIGVHETGGSSDSGFSSIAVATVRRVRREVVEGAVVGVIVWLLEPVADSPSASGGKV
ncbi:hypothetical protein ACIQB5_41830 [Streptomyces sp. NPDC088560]|uniref:hypothetical protein n=1 Tax=Streptomyces sp. NPDC088560 TaxID=3365868 RepID=UPI00381E17F6